MKPEITRGRRVSDRPHRRVVMRKSSCFHGNMYAESFPKGKKEDTTGIKLLFCAMFSTVSQTWPTLTLTNHLADDSFNPIFYVRIIRFQEVMVSVFVNGEPGFKPSTV